MMSKKSKGFLMGAFVMAMWASVFVGMFTVWAEHQAEQPITEAAYIEMVGGYGK